jgi:hypothetical protein
MYPFVVFTSEDSEEWKEKMLKAGVAALLSFPYQPGWREEKRPSFILFSSYTDHYIRYAKNT